VPPEVIEVGGVYRCRLDFLRFEACRCHGPVFPAFEFQGGDAAQEAGFRHGAPTEPQAFGREGDSLLLHCRHHLRADLVRDRDSLQRESVPRRVDIKRDRFPDGVCPTFPIRPRAQLYCADVVLRKSRQGREDHEQRGLSDHWKHGDLTVDGDGRTLPRISCSCFLWPDDNFPAGRALPPIPVRRFRG
jgi:hypothetical protein